MSEASRTADCEARVTQLEEVVSYQQHLVQQLNDEVVKLRSIVDLLEHRHTAQEERLRWMMENRLTIDDLPDEKPPHY